MKTPNVWVVEMLSPATGDWEPQAMAGLRSVALDVLKEWRENYPDYRFRIAKYVRGAK